MGSFKRAIDREVADEIVKLTVEIHSRVKALEPLIYGSAPKTTTRKLQGYLTGASYIRFQVEDLLMRRARPPEVGTWSLVLGDQIGKARLTKV